MLALARPEPCRKKIPVFFSLGGGAWIHGNRKRVPNIIVYVSHKKKKKKKKKKIMFRNHNQFT
jgi:hypothetical protein